MHLNRDPEHSAKERLYIGGINNHKYQNKIKHVPPLVTSRKG